MTRAQGLGGFLVLVQNQVGARQAGGAALEHRENVVLAEEFEPFLTGVAVQGVGGDVGVAVVQAHRHVAAGPQAGHFEAAEVGLGIGVGCVGGVRCGGPREIHGQRVGAELGVGLRRGFGQDGDDGALGCVGVGAGDERGGARIGVGCVAGEGDGQAVGFQGQGLNALVVAGLGLHLAHEGGLLNALEARGAAGCLGV